MNIKVDNELDSLKKIDIEEINALNYAFTVCKLLAIYLVKSAETKQNIDRERLIITYFQKSFQDPSKIESLETAIDRMKAETSFVELINSYDLEELTELYEKNYAQVIKLADLMHNQDFNSDGGYIFSSTLSEHNKAVKKLYAKKSGKNFHNLSYDNKQFLFNLINDLAFACDGCTSLSDHSNYNSLLVRNLTDLLPQYEYTDFSRYLETNEKLNQVCIAFFEQIWHLELNLQNNPNSAVIRRKPKLLI